MQDPTKQFYEEHAQEYAQCTNDLHPTELLEEFMKRVTSRGKVLDVGCAAGRDMKILEEHGFQTTGLDYSRTLIEIAQKVVPEARFLEMDMRELPLDETFDGIIANTSLLHLPREEVPAVITALSAMLRAGGALAISVQKGTEEGLVEDERYKGARKYYTYFTKEEMRNFLEDAGCTIVFEEVRWAEYNLKPLLELVAVKE